MSDVGWDRWSWIRRATALFVALSMWVPFMAFCTRQQSDITLARFLNFEVLLAALTFGSMGCLHALRHRRASQSLS